MIISAMPWVVLFCPEMSFAPWDIFNAYSVIRPLGSRYAFALPAATGACRLFT
jgi:hypothetical protein